MNGSYGANENEVIGVPSYTFTASNQTSLLTVPEPLVQLRLLPDSGKPVVPFGGFGFDGAPIGQGGQTEIYSK